VLRVLPEEEEGRAVLVRVLEEPLGQQSIQQTGFGWGPCIGVGLPD